MAVEIERKFLVEDDRWRSLAQGYLYRQGYIATQDLTTVRIRTIGDQAYLTIKGKNTGMTRLEFEYEIPAVDANQILTELCSPPLIEKYRYCLDYQGKTWEVDEFLGDNQGLILAEVELTDADEQISLPPWIGEEVTNDARYYNVNLAKHPYKNWSN
ncbi:CYTH domain-containing protein [Synechocystis salina]|uniref:CYTH domain-containing protein n=1 Tax=Synechocystis salina LEGE 00031 TaxID=1828736 RepID=A0ABR9VSW6_9SYNC|nr:CYTH domain-containing protein [Synechocystis salina]MBE9240617.1 CYTH domain-containing protein [Synechocystis salina LEGE 00041]MBE9253983.1 CYTH domain-containing protein [Synechocystis salina LEGE 00031]